MENGSQAHNYISATSQANGVCQASSRDASEDSSRYQRPDVEMPYRSQGTRSKQKSRVDNGNSRTL